MPSSIPDKVAIAIPTLNAGESWQACLDAIEAQTLRPHRRLVIDSSSNDGTVAQASAMGFEAITIGRSDFNHGSTRQLAIQFLDDCEIIVFLTQDAILATKQSLAELVHCFCDPAVAVAYGRQLPRPDASAIEAHARIFNYGGFSLRKDLVASSVLGAKVFFCSNSFAAYRRSMLLKLGGFHRNLIVGEDAEFSARAVLAGYANIYCASAEVYHSHNYRIADVFCRYFDTGVFHARNAWMHQQFGSHGAEGARFVWSELRYLIARSPLQIPRAILHTIAKVVGYRIGRHERILPNNLKRRLSMTPNYWLPRKR